MKTIDLLQNIAILPEYEELAREIACSATGRMHAERIACTQAMYAIALGCAEHGAGAFRIASRKEYDGIMQVTIHLYAAVGSCELVQVGSMRLVWPACDLM